VPKEEQQDQRIAVGSAKAERWDAACNLF